MTYMGPVVDGFVHHRWLRQEDLVSYLPSGWQEFIGRPGTLPGGAGAIRVVPSRAFRHPLGDAEDGTAPAGGGPPGSDLATLQAQLLDVADVRRAVLGHDDGGLLASTITDYYLAREVCRAANDWCVDRWLSGADDRLHGLVLVPNQTPDEAAAEIRRIGVHPRMAGVVLGGNGAGKAFGHRIYHPIYAACAELDLPVVLHVGGDAAPDALTTTAPAGNPSTFTEYAAMLPAPVMTHLVSFILHGVFERFPGLRLLVVGAGAAWLPALFWRLDGNWRGLRREVPWVRRHPSEYFLESVRVTPWPLDLAEDPDRYGRALGAFGPAQDFLLYASGYPERGYDTVARTAASLPEAWHAPVLHDNAEAFFRWGAPSATRAPVAAAELPSDR